MKIGYLPATHSDSKLSAKVDCKMLKIKSKHCRIQISWQNSNTVTFNENKVSSAMQCLFQFCSGNVGNTKLWL